MEENYKDIFQCKSCKKTIREVDYYISYCPFCGKDQNISEELDLENDVEGIVYEWLSQTLKIDPWLVPETVKNQMATVFLLVWPILETKVFNNDLSHLQIKRISESVQNRIPNKELNEIAEYFYNRYQDKNKYKKLVQDYEWSLVTRLLKYPFDSIYKHNKIAFMIYVVYRYRNNIFHGIKSIKEWDNYSKEIKYCIRFMVLLGNCIENE